MRFHLRQIKVGAAAACQRFFGVVEEVHGKIENAASHRLAIDEHMFLIQVPAARTRDENRRFLIQAVLLAVLFKRDRTPERIAEVALSVDHVVPGGAVRVLEIGHECRRSAVQGVDDHLAIRRSGYFHPAVEQVCVLRRDCPFGIANRFRVRQEVRQPAAIVILLARRPAPQQLLSARLELTVQSRDECERLRRQNFSVLGVDVT